jgi:hypothetical protein
MIPPFWSGTFGIHLFHTDGFLVCLLESHNDVLCRIFATQLPGNCFNPFLRLCVSEDFLSEEIFVAL